MKIHGYVYAVKHACGWGPFDERLFSTHRGANAYFNKSLRGLKASEGYVKGSAHEQKVPDIIDPDTIRKVHFTTGSETNNENGREYDEQEEEIVITKRVIFV
jgi:hypothetical protein